MDRTIVTWVRRGLILLLAPFAGCVTPTLRTEERPTLQIPALPSSAEVIEGGRAAIFTVLRDPAARLTSDQRSAATKLCPFGLPRSGPGLDVGAVQLVVHTGYVLGFSTSDKVPLWVCEIVQPSHLSGKARRPGDDAFRPDALIPQGLRAELGDYAHSGYDRGHMAPAGDETVDEKLKRETFLLSNMAPQAPALNRQIWAKLEERVRRWAEQRGALYVITGPLYYDPAEEDPTTADGRVVVKQIGEDHVAVPTHFYKVVVSSSGGHVEAIAFVLENRGYVQPWEFAPLERSVHWIEERSGLDFMPELPAPEAGAENSVPPLWQ